MEKLASVLWKPSDRSDAEFGRALLASAPALMERGAAHLRIDVVDDAVAAGRGVRVGRMEPPKAAVVFYWLDEADARGPVEQVLAGIASRLESFLVVESVPLHNRAHVAPLGERTPGFNLVTCIEPKPGLDYADFVRHWHGEHRSCALETQSTFAYVRNEIVRAFGAGAPPWAAIVEESFPLPALDDPRVWYRWEGSEPQYRRHRQRMIESCLAFLDLEKVESHPMSEYVFER